MSSIKLDDDIFVIFLDIFLKSMYPHYIHTSQYPDSCIKISCLMRLISSSIHETRYILVNPVDLVILVISWICASAARVYVIATPTCVPFPTTMLI